MKITISKSQWELMGKKAGWIKTASGYDRFSKDLSDILEGQVLANRKKSPEEIANIIKGDNGLVNLMNEESMTYKDLMGLITGTLQLYKWMR